MRLMALIGDHWEFGDWNPGGGDWGGSLLEVLWPSTFGCQLPAVTVGPVVIKIRMNEVIQGCALERGPFKTCFTFQILSLCV